MSIESHCLSHIPYEQEKMGSSPGADPASNESRHRDITSLSNTNEWCEAWDDVLASLNQKRNVSKSTEQAPGRQRSYVGRQALDPVDHQVVSEQEQVLTEFLVFVFIWRICFSLPALATIAVFTTITPSHTFILFQQRNRLYILFHWKVYRRWKRGVDRLIKT